MAFQGELPSWQVRQVTLPSARKMPRFTTSAAGRSVGPEPPRERNRAASWSTSTGWEWFPSKPTWQAVQSRVVATLVAPGTRRQPPGADADVDSVDGRAPASEAMMRASCTW